jgi:hypothetical protein
MSSRIPSNEQAMKAWFRDYSSGLASVGIRLGLTPTQQSELEQRLLAICQSLERVRARKRSVRSGAVIDRPVDPIRRRWLDDHVSVQGNT